MIALVENGVGAVAEPAPIEKLKRTLSASRLNCWLQCRLKFYFRYVLKLTKPKTAALHYGSVVHLVLQHWNMARWRKQPFEIAKLKQVFETGWLDQGGVIDWDGEEPEQKTSAWNVLEKYFTETPIKADEMPEAVEVPGAARAAGAHRGAGSGPGRRAHRGLQDGGQDAGQRHGAASERGSARLLLGVVSRMHRQTRVRPGTASPRQNQSSQGHHHAGGTDAGIPAHPAVPADGGLCGRSGPRGLHSGTRLW